MRLTCWQFLADVIPIDSVLEYPCQKKTISIKTISVALAEAKCFPV